MAENTCGIADDATIPTVEYDGDSAAVASKFEHHYTKATRASVTLV